jgi:hypothetical protein
MGYGLFGGANSLGGGGGAGGMLSTFHSLLMKCPFYRSMGQPCRLPNRRWKQLTSGPGGTCCAAFSGDGSRVAAAVGEAPCADAFHIVIFKCAYDSHADITLTVCGSLQI